MAVVGQVEKTASLSASQSTTYQTVDAASRYTIKVVCDYRSQQMTNNDGKHKYNNSAEQVVGCMFASYSGGTPTLLSTAHLRPVM